ncbi:MAG: UDP-2,3-diacylglucosamine diphosphatase [Syntrophales bacterium]|jgi:UDP-2,3-diacylglucosamine hydrolase
MNALFISDAHLKNAADPHGQRMLRFLDSLQGMRIEQIIVVGDFFDFWFSRRDRVYPGYKPFIDRLNALAKQGVQIHWLEGNHDFHLEEYFGKMPGMQVSDEWAAMEIGEQKIFVSHGDTIDTNNRSYLTLRKMLRSSAFYYFQKMLPLHLVWHLADLSSRFSKELTADKSERIAEIMEQFAVRKFSEGYDAVILGHCHKPMIKHFNMDGHRTTFATLGDWIHHHSYLLFKDGQYMLYSFEV